MTKIMCKFMFSKKNDKNNEGNFETNYELDCTIYNGKYTKSNDDWLRYKTSIFRDSRNKVHPIQI